MDIKIKRHRYIFPLVAIFILFGSCKKEDRWIEWKVMNDVWVEQFRSQNADNVSMSPSGLLYRVVSDPNITETRPNANSVVLCSYELRLIDSTLIENVTDGIVYLSSAIAGFTEGLKQIHVHGDVELWIPYDLGYGSNGSGTEGYTSFIPPYSLLHFKIHLSRATSE